MRYKGKKGSAWEAVKRWCRRTYKDCYTCGARTLTGKNAQAGHCWPVGLVGSNNTLSWDHNQIRLQCGRCNGVGEGMQEMFVARLIKDLGQKIVMSMRSRIHKVDPVKNWDDIIKKFDSL